MPSSCGSFSSTSSSQLVPPASAAQVLRYAAVHNADTVAATVTISVRLSTGESVPFVETAVASGETLELAGAEGLGIPAGAQLVARLDAAPTTTSPSWFARWGADG